MTNEYNTMNFDSHDVLEDTHNNVNLVKMTSGKYEGLVFSLGKVSIGEEEDEDGSIKLSFEYDIHDDTNVEYVKEELEQYLGDFVKELLIYNLNRNEVVYTGGTDE